MPTVESTRHALARRASRASCRRGFAATGRVQAATRIVHESIHGDSDRRILSRGARLGVEERHREWPFSTGPPSSADRTSLYRAVKPLVRRRCLQILPGQTRRERTATLTETGRRLLADALPLWEQVQGRFVSALGPQAWAALTSGLRQVVPTLHALESGAPVAGSSPARARAGPS